MQKFLSNQNKLFLILSIIILQGFLFKPIQVLADLPTGNAVKDPNAILETHSLSSKLNCKKFNINWKKLVTLLEEEDGPLSQKLLQNVNLY